MEERWGFAAEAVVGSARSDVPFLHVLDGTEDKVARWWWFGWGVVNFNHSKQPALTMSLIYN